MQRGEDRGHRYDAPMGLLIRRTHSPNFVLTFDCFVLLHGFSIVYQVGRLVSWPASALRKNDNWFTDASQTIVFDGGRKNKEPAENLMRSNCSRMNELRGESQWKNRSARFSRNRSRSGQLVSFRWSNSKTQVIPKSNGGDEWTHMIRVPETSDAPRWDWCFVSDSIWLISNRMCAHNFDSFNNNWRRL